MQRKMNKMEMKVMQVISIEKLLRFYLERPMLCTKIESDLTDLYSVEAIFFILGAYLNMLHTERNLERALVWDHCFCFDLNKMI